MTKRKSLIAKVGKYLIEIIIIIVGITISFALNDWEKKQTARSSYKNYLKNLQKDIHVDSLQMVNDIRSYSSKMRGVNLIFKYHKGFSQDSIALLGEAQNSLSNFILFLPNDNTFQILSSTGDFKVFENEKLVSELVQLYQYDYAFIDMMGAEANQERTTLLKPYLIDNIFFEDDLTFPVVRTDIPKVIQDRTFRNICLAYKGSCYSAISAYRRALKRLVNVNNMLTEELKKYDNN